VLTDLQEEKSINLLNSNLSWKYSSYSCVVEVAQINFLFVHMTPHDG